MDLSTDITEKKPMIEVGEQITCPNGHHICKARSARGEDVFESQEPWPVWTDWEQPKPELGQSLPIFCTECDQPWMLQTVVQLGEAWGPLFVGRMPIHVFIEGRGWVPELPKDLPPMPVKPSQG